MNSLGQYQGKVGGAIKVMVQQMRNEGGEMVDDEFGYSYLRLFSSVSGWNLF